MKIKIKMLDAKLNLTCSKKELIELVEKHDHEFKFEDWVVMDGVFLANGEHMDIYVDGELGKKRRLKSLVHELSHATTELMRAKGINDDETRSYLLDYMFGKSLKYVESYKG